MEPTPVEVEGVEQVGPTTVGMTLETPPTFEATPGEFVLVRGTVDGEDLARHYTLSSPYVDETFEITVGIDPDGTLSPWLAERSPGDELRIEGPFGTVTHERGDAVAVAGGPGIGAALAVAERAVETGGEAAVVYQPESDPAHRDRLEALVERGGTVRVVGDERALADAVAEVIDVGQVYVFGFRPFVETVRSAIETAGGDPDDAAIEPFS
jgi:ferredoxin-NADP reductase